MRTEKEQVIKFEVHRFDPQQERHYVTTYDVPIRKGMTVLDALMYIKDNLDGTLVFRHSCRMGQCGSCGIMINGEPMLACYTQVLHLDSDRLVIEPLQNMPVLRDLIVDIQKFFDTYNKIRPILIKSEDKLKKPVEFTQVPKELKRFWDLTLCTKCSICYSACPAAIDDNFFGPSTYATSYRFMIDSRDEGLDERLKGIADNVWLCTSCNSCTLFCPKEVDASSSIVEGRGLAVETGIIPRTAMDVLTGTFKYHNPMGMHPNKRMEWTKDLKINTFPEVTKADILYFVCCQTAYDPRNQEIARSMASLLNKLDINFATLGIEEWCCGDHQLRLGEKGLFENLADHNISMFKKFNADKILTLSPHCYNTFKNIKPYSNSELHVQHYTELIAEAINSGKLRFTKSLDMKVTYHDPCFLGKRNGIYDDPRHIIEAIKGVELAEMKRRKENSFCCGGGAGRVWTEDATPEKRPNVNRVKEALELDTELIVTACPFCVTTLEDAVKVLDAEDKIGVKDILELLIEVV
ncbi:MAG: succinate dehydrogenase iron-sulfur subunit [Candidatus Bathyarchaeota archaeon]|jgi:succinate dehydrogenase/fumarate reductase iron-sulfur protein